MISSVGVISCDCLVCIFFFFSSRRRHTMCALVTGVQTCALPIYRFQQAGIHVDRLALYDRQAAVWDAQQSDKLAAALAAPAPCVFLLTSAEGVDAVHANMLRLGLQDAWARARFVVIHERVASRLQ